jgi:hypothetical protein
MLALAAATGTGAYAAVTPTPNAAAIQASIKAHNGVLTAAQATQLGLQPDTVYLDTPQARAAHVAVDAATTKLAAQPPSPDSASGCSDDVCIEVIGSGLTVDNWNTWAYYDGCSYAVYWEDREIAFTGEEVCDDGLLETLASGFGEFENDTQVCNTWIGVAGEPCETVHD